MNEKREYIHFLRYDMLCFDQIEYGFTDLFYNLSGSTLWIKELDHRNKSEHELRIAVRDKTASIETILEDFLVDQLSYPESFAGYPVHEQSDFFSAEQFAQMVKKGVEISDKRIKSAIRLHTDSEIVSYCRSARLDPEPEGSGPNNWKARCPSGGQHYIMVSAGTNEWGCGYCRHKGDLNALKEWVGSKEA